MYVHLKIRFHLHVKTCSKDMAIRDRNDGTRHKARDEVSEELCQRDDPASKNHI